jgi:fucose 4-O-acetylase-like acetyltransferase
MNRNLGVDIIKGLAILMIVDIHIESGAVFQVGKTFHVIAFFVASGILMGIKSDLENNRDFIMKKAKGLMYPYITMSMISILITCVISIMRNGFVYSDHIENAIFKTISLQGIGTLWFLPVMFFGSIIANILIRNVKTQNKNLLLCIGNGIAVITILIEWGGNSTNGFIVLILTSVLAAGVIIIGYAISDFYQNLSNICNTKKLCVVAIIAFILNNMLVDTFSGDIHKAVINNPLVFIIGSVLGEIFVIAISIVLSKLKRVGEFIAYIGRNSLIIMVTHKELYINYIVYLVLRELNLGGKLTSIFTLVIVLCIELLIIKIVNSTSLLYLIRFPSRRNYSD